ncbi:MAG: MaoC/PaaZ C-terminal domain-containing protein [Polyangiaceae bacterium]
MTTSHVAEHSFDSIEEGFQTSHEYSITDSVYQCLVGPFGDVSPLHVDDAYAKERGFEGRVMHGAILNGFLSHFVGVHFPGKPAILQSVNIQYKSPSFLGDSVRIDAKVAQKVEAVRAIVLEVTFTNTARSKVVAKAKVQVGVAS